MLGSALFTTVTSSSSMNTAMQTTPSVHHLLPRSVEVVVAPRWVVDMGAHRRGAGEQGWPRRSHVAPARTPAERGWIGGAPGAAPDAPSSPTSADGAYSPPPAGFTAARPAC